MRCTDLEKRKEKVESQFAALISGDWPGYTGAGWPGKYRRLAEGVNAVHLPSSFLAWAKRCIAPLGLSVWGRLKPTANAVG